MRGYPFLEPPDVCFAVLLLKSEVTAEGFRRTVAKDWPVTGAPYHEDCHMLLAAPRFETWQHA